MRDFFITQGVYVSLRMLGIIPSILDFSWHQWIGYLIGLTGLMTVARPAK